MLHVGTVTSSSIAYPMQGSSVIHGVWAATLRYRDDLIDNERHRVRSTLTSAGVGNHS